MSEDRDFLIRLREALDDAVDAYKKDQKLRDCAAELLSCLKSMLPENNQQEQHLRPSFETCEKARNAIARAEGAE